MARERKCQYCHQNQSPMILEGVVVEGFAVLVRTRGNDIHVDLNGELSFVCVGV